MSNKYHAVKVQQDGYTFDSKREWARYIELVVMERSGTITHLEVHPRFNLLTWNRDDEPQRVAEYVADFGYCEGERYVVEDVKGVKTAMYRLKKRWMRAQYGIDVVEVS